MVYTLTEVLAEGKGGTARDRRRKPECKAMSRRTETTYKAESPGKSARHDKALDSGDTVNVAVA